MHNALDLRGQDSGVETRDAGRSFSAGALRPQDLLSASSSLLLMLILFTCDLLERFFSRNNSYLSALASYQGNRHCCVFGHLHSNLHSTVTSLSPRSLPPKSKATLLARLVRLASVLCKRTHASAEDAGSRIGIRRASGRLQVLPSRRRYPSRARASIHAKIANGMDGREREPSRRDRTHPVRDKGTWSDGASRRVRPAVRRETVRARAALRLPAAPPVPRARRERHGPAARARPVIS
jgi:hypothetical protein